MWGSVTMPRLTWKLGVGEAAPGIGVERAADAAEDAHGVGIELLRAGGGGKQEQRDDQQEPAEQAVIPDQDSSPSRRIRSIPAPGSPGAARLLRV